MPFTVGLAGKDEELFVVCLKELMKAVDVVETEPMVDLLKAFVERQAFSIDEMNKAPFNIDRAVKEVVENGERRRRRTVKS